jgi:hypothetical protein
MIRAVLSSSDSLRTGPWSVHYGVFRLSSSRMIIANHRGMMIEQSKVFFFSFVFLPGKGQGTCFCFHVVVGDVQLRRIQAILKGLRLECIASLPRLCQKGICVIFTRQTAFG